jgi:hypothetical protein
MCWLLYLLTGWWNPFPYALQNQNLFGSLSSHEFGPSAWPTKFHPIRVQMAFCPCAPVLTPSWNTFPYRRTRSPPNLRDLVQFRTRTGSTSSGSQRHGTARRGSLCRTQNTRTKKKKKKRIERRRREQSLPRRNRPHPWTEYNLLPCLHWQRLRCLRCLFATIYSESLGREASARKEEGEGRKRTNQAVGKI